MHSPIDGFVTVKPMYQGMYVTPETELYRVSDPSTVWIWGDIHENEVGLVAVGQTAAITLPSAPDRQREAVVSYVSPTIEPATRTLRVRFDVDNRGGALEPGMYATVELTTPLGEVLAVPEEAVIDTGERQGDRVVVSAQFLLDSESRLRAAAAGPAHGGH